MHLPVSEIYNFVDLARSSNTKQNKLDALSYLLKCYSVMGSEERNAFERYFQFVFEPTISFGVKWIQPTRKGKEDYGFMEFLENLASRELTGDKALQVLENLANDLNSVRSELLKLALDKSLDCGISRKTFEKVFPDVLERKTHMMKCEPASEKIMAGVQYPGMLQLKEDGIRINAIVNKSSVMYETYNGTKFKIEDELLTNDFLKLSLEQETDVLYFDGELVFVDDTGVRLPRRTSNGLALRLIKGSLPKEQYKNIRVVLWDIITKEMMDGEESGENNIVRYNHLVDLILGHSTDSRIEVIETNIVYDYYDVMEYTNKYIKQGMEGSIFKNAASYWEPKRSKNCIKFKAERECELVVKGIVPGTRKYEGMIGSLVCESSCGKLSVDVSGMTDAERARTDWVGKIITVRFNEVISKKNSEMKSLFLPRIVEERFDKDTADSLEYILVQ